MSKSIDVEKLNYILEDLCTYELGRKFNKVFEEESKDFYDEKPQGDVGERVSVFNVGEDLFLKVIETSDSYGGGVGVSSVKFVERKQKVVEVYE